MLAILEIGESLTDVQSTTAKVTLQEHKEELEEQIKENGDLIARDFKEIMEGTGFVVNVYSQSMKKMITHYAFEIEA